MSTDGEDQLDRLFSNLYYFTGICSIFLNSLLIYMIVNSGTNRIKEYRVLLGHTTVIDLTKSVLLTLIQPRFVAYGSIYTYTALGVARYMEPTAVYVMQQTALVMSVLSIFALPLSFAYRYYVIKHGPIKMKTLLCICLLVDSLGIIQLICAVLGECNANYIKEEISRITHENFTNAMVVGSDLKKKPVAIVTALFVSLPAFPVYISIICLRKKALTLQALVPPIFVFPPLMIYFLQQMGIVDVPVVEYLIFFIVSITPSVNALLTLYCVKPYRDTILALLGSRILQNSDLKNLSSTEARHKSTVFKIPKIKTVFYVPNTKNNAS